MIVVLDTSPLNYLILIGRVDVLEVLYGRTIGTLGALRDAHLSGLLDLRKSTDEIVRLGFRVSPSLLQTLLDSV